MTLIAKGEDQSSAALTEAADVVLSFGALMMRAGNTASRTREWVEVLARKLGFDAVSIGLSLDNITASLRRSGAYARSDRPESVRSVSPRLSGLRGRRSRGLRRAKSRSSSRRSSRQSLPIRAC